MNITKHQFFEALKAFFEKEQATYGRYYEYSLNLKKLLLALDNLYDLAEEGGHHDDLVHIGHTFGPFGFKIKE